MAIQPIDSLRVALQFAEQATPVGTLMRRAGRLLFEYDDDFLKGVAGQRLELSPLHLPLKPGPMHFDAALFEGLPGVFDDSLPDGWGRLLIDRCLRQQGHLPQQFGPLERLAWVGTHGMGALIYEVELGQDEAGPEASATFAHPLASLWPTHLTGAAHQAGRQAEHKAGQLAQAGLDRLAEHSQTLLAGHHSEVLAELIALNGSSAGARPKAMVLANEDCSQLILSAEGDDPLTWPAGYRAWMVKFANQSDGPEAGAVEYLYQQMAQAAGLTVSPSHLFDQAGGAGYFASQRFDRHAGGRYHLHSVAGLLHSDFRVPALDYLDLAKATQLLTRDHRQLQQLFRLATFNVLAHNRDDHGKNFSFLMNASGQWHLAPAYDLTCSSGPGGEHSTMVAGEGRDPSLDDLKRLAAAMTIDAAEAERIIDQCRQALSQWPSLAKGLGLSAETIAFVGRRLR